MEAEGRGTLKRLRRVRIFYGWWIVSVSFLGEVVMGASSYAFPIFYKQMAGQLHWSRSTVAMAPTIRTIIGAFISPVVGSLVDRRGPRDLIVFGAILSGFTSLAMSRINAIWQYFLVYSVIGTIAQAAEGGLVTQATVAKWFIRKRGRAMAILAVGITLGGVIFTPIATYFITNHSWRLGYVFIGITTWILLIVPAALVMRRRPEDMGLLPDGAGPAHTANPSAKALQGQRAGDKASGDLEKSWTLQEALRSPMFWLILVSLDLGSMSITGIMMHQYNYMTDKGFSEGTAAMVVMIYAINAIVAKVIFGFMAERMHIRYLVMVVFGGAAAGIFIFNQANSEAMLITYAFVYGLTRGAYILVTPLAWANYFGREFLGTIRGFSRPFSLATNVGGPLLAAWIYDTTKSYSIAFTVFSVTSLLGAFLIFFAKPTEPPRLRPQLPRI